MCFDWKIISIIAGNIINTLQKEMFVRNYIRSENEIIAMS